MKEPLNARRIRSLIELEAIRQIILKRPCLVDEPKFEGWRICGRCGYTRQWKPDMKRLAHCGIPFEGTA